MLTPEEALRYTPGKDFAQGHIFLINKPLGWTSFNVVGKVKHLLRYHLGLRKIKVGHAGTLDPLATGLMVICVGRATRLAAELTGQDKRYEAEFTVGATTPSFDLETPVQDGFPVEHITTELIQEVAVRLTGPQMQKPPLFSAKRVDGKRAYTIARKGEDMELPPVPIVIHQFEILTTVDNRITASIHCSKGTYIRALARDFGKLLGSAAYLSKLTRTHSGKLSLANAITIPDLETFIQSIAPYHAPTR